jgi:hypothetical protein
MVVRLAKKSSFPRSTHQKRIGSNYVGKQTLTLEMLKRLCDYDFIVGVKETYVGPMCNTYCHTK